MIVTNRVGENRETIDRNGVSVEKIRYGDMWLEVCKGAFQPEVTEYVAKVYYDRNDYQFDTNFPEVLEEMLREDELFAPVTSTYTLKDEQGSIVGTIRTIMKQQTVMLPIEREFGVRLQEWTRKYTPVTRIYEIARFAVTCSANKGIMVLFRELFKDGTLEDFVVASLDKRVLRGLRKIGFHWFDLQEPKHYLGSETCPVAMRPHEHVGGMFTDIIEDMKRNSIHKIS
jgi:hypothetical protein